MPDVGRGGQFGAGAGSAVHRSAVRVQIHVLARREGVTSDMKDGHRVNIRHDSFGNIEILRRGHCQHRLTT
jgi:hypothetical protein